MSVRLVAALAMGMVLVSSLSNAQTPAGSTETKVTVKDLIGLDPIAVRARMAGLPANWAMASPDLTLSSDHGVLSFMSSFYVTEDPVEAEQQEHYESGDFGHPVQPFLECHTFVDLPDETDTGFGSDLTLRFTDGRLTAIYRGLPSPPQPPVKVMPTADGRLDFEAMHKVALATPHPSVFIATAGRLPLQDGDGFVGRWPKQALSSDVELTTRCAPWQAPEVPKRSGSAGVGPEVMLAPLAVLEPPLNAGRIAARNNGRAVLARLKVGAPLGRSLDDFAASTTGVRVFRDPAADYAVIALDMGAWSSNHLDNKDDVAMIGIQAGKVAWIMPSGWRGRFLALSADLLCLDDHFLQGKVRPGCDANGSYKP